MEFEWHVISDKSPAEAIKAVEAALAERKFSVLFHLHVNEKLQEKGLSLDTQVHVLEVCSAPRAKQALEANPAVAYFLPCKIIVKATEAGTEIGMLRPTMLMQVMGDSTLAGFAEEVETILTEAVNAAK